MIGHDRTTGAVKHQQSTSKIISKCLQAETQHLLATETNARGLSLSNLFKRRHLRSLQYRQPSASNIVSCFCFDIELLCVHVFHCLCQQVTRKVEESYKFIVKTKLLLHTTVFTPEDSCTRNLYMKHHLDQNFFTPNTFYTHQKRSVAVQIEFEHLSKTFVQNHSPGGC